MIIALLLYARTNYTGYSGAPGSSGTCASSCHGCAGGTIQVGGFPTEYVPNENYEILITHAGGNQISQFNGSCRIGTGNQNAGLITAGTNTAIYNAGCETNGIHFSSAYQSSGTFNWAAPAEGTGEVRLYIAGQQGGYSGPNSSIVLLASEHQTAVEETSESIPSEYALFSAYPNPFNATTMLTYELSQADKITLTIYDIQGNLIKTLFQGIQQPGQHQIAWDASEVASGIYFCRLSAPNFQQTQKMVLIR